MTFLLILAYTLLEAYSKHIFYIHNRAARFKFPHLDKEKKKIDAAMFTLFMMLASPWQLWFAAAVIRLTVIDGVFNHSRDLPWAHVGTRDVFGRTIRKYADRLGISVLSLAATVRIALAITAIISVIFYYYGTV